MLCNIVGTRNDGIPQFGSIDHFEHSLGNIFIATAVFLCLIFYSLLEGFYCILYHIPHWDSIDIIAIKKRRWTNGRTGPAKRVPARKTSRISLAGRPAREPFFHHLCSTIKRIAVRSSPSITTLANAGIHTRSIPAGARYPRAMATALIA